MTRSEDILLAAAVKGALVLTATRRLARRLRRLYDARQTAARRHVWATPTIISADNWLQQAADRLGEGWRLLAPSPARRLWETIIEADGAGSAQELLQGSASARAAEEAHALLVEFGGDPMACPLTADHAAFLCWRRIYLERLRKEGWLDRATLAETVVAAVAAGRLPLPECVYFAGFDTLPPRFQRLAASFSARGTQCREIPFTGAVHENPLRFACADARDEVRRAACWAHHLLEAGEGEIGIVVPDLQHYRAAIERIFREEIDPAAQVRPAAEETRFSLSLGEPLAGKGAIAAALEILATGRQLPLVQAGFLLRTPYLGGALGEEELRARLDGTLRKEGESQVALARIVTLAGGRKSAAEPRLASVDHICEQLLAAASDRRERLPGAWAGHFASLLQAVGWPGERPLDSGDFQVVKAFREKVLPQLAAFDAVSGAVSRSEALALLRRLAVETEFQSEGVESPIQVIGLLEAAGLHFRHLWVIGLHDGVLPAPPRPNPFLPVPLQIAAGMPHADADREAHFASQVIARLFAAGDSVIFSHPLREGDADLLPSPLIRHLPPADLLPADSRAPALLFRQRVPPVETIFDPAGPPLAATEQVRGGTAILKDQALCPFRAFARHRLSTASLETPDIGLDPRERGSLLHKVMELFWQRTGTHAELLALAAEERRQRIAVSIDAAVESLFPGSGEGMLPLLLGLEKERLLRLIDAWLLQAEMPRSSFTVQAEEKECNAIFGGLPFSTRIDRIDRLADGRRVVLDYKTGRVDAADLLGERLLEPQLPMYALGLEGKGVAAVAFASFQDKKKPFHGTAASGDILPGVKAIAEAKAGDAAGLDWDALCARWQQQLDELGRAFAAGAAAVDPVNAQKACRYCDCAPLCRIGEVYGDERGDA